MAQYNIVAGTIATHAKTPMDLHALMTDVLNFDDPNSNYGTNYTFQLIVYLNLLNFLAIKVKMFKSAIAIALSLLATSHAQQGYSGNITTEGIGQCPMSSHAETHIPWKWEPTKGNVCVKLPRPYSDSYHAALLGEVDTPVSVMPPHFGGCRDAECRDCTLVDIEYGDEPGLIKVDCLELKDAPYLFVGVKNNQ
ncbi:hypothetical protein EYZ11_002982 [Aspergillus tanneri]|uniref:Uncharacterized protein n=1 Tax=Aspergillus tanneri TaxID=1220188 RepID=A0A4S3JPF8_9EURO|nr:uncharacterized protein ATNIH1004_000895 [Aspergillus tanneri]KAA8651995.1 hypothetical protein ATNIH1004_000895 [Aspergillus tanneri]THC97559.1 hypothetical protein EYZ11_002982 [Aspergillus tanneri]